MNKIKNSALIVLLLLILCVTVAYTSYSITITTNGVATETNDWNLFFKEVKSSVSENSDVLTNNPSITNNRQTIELNPIINTPNSSVTYTVTIENNGLVDAIADKDFIIWDTRKDSPNIHYDVSFPGDIKKGEEVTFEIRFYSNDIVYEELNDNNETLIGTLNYKHANN